MSTNFKTGQRECDMDSRKKWFSKLHRFWGTFTRKQNWTDGRPSSNEPPVALPKDHFTALRVEDLESLPPAHPATSLVLIQLQNTIDQTEGLLPPPIKAQMERMRLLVESGLLDHPNTVSPPDRFPMRMCCARYQATLDLIKPVVSRILKDLDVCMPVANPAGKFPTAEVG